MKILLKKNYAKAEKNTVVLPDTLKVEFESDLYTLDCLVVTAKNGKVEKTYKGTNIDVSPLLFGGVLSFHVALYHHDEIVKEWEVEPILVKETSTHFELTNYLLNLEKRVKSLEDQHKSLL